MKKVFPFIGVLMLCVLANTALGQKAETNSEIAKPKGYEPPVIRTSDKMNELLTKAIDETIAEFKTQNFAPKDVSATIILMDGRGTGWTSGEFRGSERIYPASVVKLFYMAALERQIEDGKVTLTPELERGLRDMIVDSSNEATQYILDVLTGTSSGPELPKKEFEAWQFKRNRVNRFFLVARLRGHQRKSENVFAKTRTASSSNRGIIAVRTAICLRRMPLQGSLPRSPTGASRTRNGPPR